MPQITFDGQAYHLEYERPQSIGKIREFYGNIPVILRAWAWCLTLGPRGLREVSEIAVLNNNYLMKQLSAIRGVTMPYSEKRRLDQVRWSVEKMKEETGVGAHELQDRTVDFGINSLWLSHHPLIVPEPFTPEPCETYSQEDLDYFAACIKQASDEAYTTPEVLTSAPHNQSIAKMKDLDTCVEPDKWAMTWRAYQRKVKSRAASKSASTSA